MTGGLHIVVLIQLIHLPVPGKDKTGEALETLRTATYVETLVNCRLPSNITNIQVICGIFKKAQETICGSLVRSKANPLGTLV